ncbi:TadE family protein [Thiomonas sp. FB-Cd]|uniref:TadE family protein n=1 Tax=Thiomonas sp. FB-Cd TaxID=1158292 RepID=UPI0004DF12DA|nr:TadE family protein [Thiomonas sp. FB-Cd]
MRTGPATRDHPPISARQTGSAIVEFALVAVLFFTVLLAIIDFGRILFQWNAAAEATRLGARMAVVCDVGDPSILAGMRNVLLNQNLTSAQLSVVYNPSGCTSSSCTSVTVSISGYQIPFISPFMGFLMPSVPAFSTTLPRESMQSINSAGQENPVCF